MRNLLCLSFACFALFGCAKTNSSGGSSETHFLALCNASCENGFSCLCGVCTESCDDDDACEALSGAASCEVTADGCSTPKVCDVECSDDDDCASLGASHDCEAGHCRAPSEDMMMSGGAGGTSGAGGTGGMSGGPDDAGMSMGALDECTIYSVAKYLIGSDSFEGCDEDENETPDPEGRARCVRQRFEAEEAFAITWDLVGTDSALKEGYIGVPSDAGFTVYHAYYDSLGFVDDDLHPDEVWLTSWTECQAFTFVEECDEVAGCLQCIGAGPNACGCGRPSAPLDPVCETHTVVPPDECEQPSCVIYGICYPEGVGTEDGCCFCENGGYSCIEPGWCPGWPSIGKRCGGEDGCSQGLECRDDIKGGNPVCTRTCNFGCPTGYECATNVPGADDQPLEAICVKPCESNGDCAVSGVSLESSCTVVDPDTNQSYCL